MKYLPKMAVIIEQVVKRYLNDKKGYSFACDGWSVVKPYVSLESYFISIFHKNKTQSFLLGFKHLDSSTGESIHFGLEDYKQSFDKHNPTTVTCDGAKNNEKAFSTSKITCNCHAIDLILKHFAECKYSSNENEKKVVNEFYSFMEKVTNSLQYKSGRDFQEWVMKYSKMNIDYEDVVSLPEVVSPTRWIGISTKLKWFYNYGLLHWRYVVFLDQQKPKEPEKENTKRKGGRPRKKPIEETSQWDHYNDFLKEVSDMIYIVSILEKAVNLLSYSKKPTIHLVIPLRITIKRLLTDFTPSTEVALLLKNAIINEIDSGRLSFNNNQNEEIKRCKTATFLFPEADYIIGSDYFEDCKTVALENYKCFSKKCVDQKKYSQEDIEMNCNNLEKVMETVRNRDKRTIKKDYLYYYLKPNMDDYFIDDIEFLTNLYKSFNDISFKGKAISLNASLTKLDQLSARLPSTKFIEKVEESKSITQYINNLYYRVTD